ncbi:MAG: hypothetical protein OXU75_01785, partial [Deltaproteobacteria bacterium]|nr:hypothetical protein [Deltaproteobacteria bacterium]
MAEIDQTEVRGNGENVQCKRPSTQRKERTMAVQPKPLLSAASAALLALSLLGPPLLPGTSEVHGQDAMKVSVPSAFQLPTSLICKVAPRAMSF